MQKKIRRILNRSCGNSWQSWGICEGKIIIHSRDGYSAIFPGDVACAIRAGKLLRGANFGRIPRHKIHRDRFVSHVRRERDRRICMHSTICTLPLRPLFSILLARKSLDRMNDRPEQDAESIGGPARRARDPFSLHSVLCAVIDPVRGIEPEH